ncbi:hypothetical protein JCM3775_007304 [Rhodotorula graminis]|uniref:mannan endo-1,4-beta-mannosidase n=1 Tax=Rhodotorula graminis (strain WP1) TaxID=578459 RepID=A0A194S5K7_RHOGW|nr:glycoside hydrolase family 5 protein [Rhodotorula graminis WP1]KPV75867.1 glycoside hydrolase family 5 protein [Rhodotorula graminis WP1]
MPSADQHHFSLSTSATSNAGNFVERRGADLFLGGQKLRFASLNAPQLLRGDESGPFEVRDTFAALAAKDGFGGVPVTRTYTLMIKSKPYVEKGHIIGWSNQHRDWLWDEERMKQMDLVLDEAHKAGVKLIIPIINQDFGDDKNWVGCTTDLTRLRYGLDSNAKARRINFWKDTTMIESFKVIIDRLANRVNTINGRRYKDEPCILAWETGNELTAGDKLPAPASWTLIMAKHLKSRAPRTLVMDGSFARYADQSNMFPNEVLSSPDVDILSYHHYGDGEARRVKKECEVARRHNKVFVSGEYGFFYQKETYKAFLNDVKDAGGAGSLGWSFRPHSSSGGHKTHSEGYGNIFSYHLPGWPDSSHPEFDDREFQIVRDVRDASFKINGQARPFKFPIPPAPGKPWRTKTASGAPAIAFQGAAWADRYRITVRGPAGERSKEAKDHTKEKSLAVDIGKEIQAVGGQNVRVSVRSISVDGVDGGESEALAL